MTNKPIILILGGTGDAVRLNAQLHESGEFALVTSLAGRTGDPTSLKGEVLSSGFGAFGGLEAFLKGRNITCVADLTHPFALEMTEKSAGICQKLSIPYVRFSRPAWSAQEGDKWISASSTIEATEKCASYKNIFLAVGRQEIEPFQNLKEKQFLIRSVEPIEFESEASQFQNLLAKGPFDLQNEIELLRQHCIEVIVSKNSGGSATYAKIEAARQLNIPVIMIQRPNEESAQAVSSLEEVISFLRSCV